MKYLYNVLVLPLLDYSSSIWDPHQACYIVQLERVQNFAARVICGEWVRDADPLKVRLGLAPLCTRRKFLQICLCRRILQNDSLVPSSTFQPHPKQSIRHLNSRPLFRPLVSTNHLKSFFPIKVVDTWNNIPEEVVTPTITTATFKKRLRSFMFN